MPWTRISTKIALLLALLLIIFPSLVLHTNYRNTEHAIAQEMNQALRRALHLVKAITMNLKNFSRVDHQEQQAANFNTCLEETLPIVWNELKYKKIVIDSEEGRGTTFTIQLPLRTQLETANKGGEA